MEECKFDKMRKWDWLNDAFLYSTNGNRSEVGMMCIVWYSGKCIRAIIMQPVVSTENKRLSWEPVECAHKNWMDSRYQNLLSCFRLVNFIKSDYVCSRAPPMLFTRIQIPLRIPHPVLAVAALKECCMEQVSYLKSDLEAICLWDSRNCPD